MVRFDESRLTTALSALDHLQRTAFAAACAERQTGSYDAYCKATESGDPDLLREALSLVWDHLSGTPITSSKFQETLDRIIELVPDEESFVTEQPYADDAVASLAYTMRTLLEDNVKNAMWAARRAYDAVDHFVMQLVNSTVVDSNAEDMMRTHPIVQTELKRQDKDLSDLLGAQRSGEDERGVFKLLRRRAQNDAAVFFREEKI